jgi:2-polyprenyl-3-methyl-5-hydroxy-6-metoxy-1,4-benzoquinol methylase
MNKTIQEIIDLLPLQKKKLTNQLNRLDKDELHKLNTFCNSMKKFLNENNISESFIAESYKNLNIMMVKEQIFFKRYGKYKSTSQGCVNDTLYNIEEKMLGHMIALALTQFLWKNHYEMMYYFKSNISSFLTKHFEVLEIGAGHGLFTEKIIDLNLNLKIDILDISETSLKLSKQIIKNSNISNSINFIHSDITNFNTNKIYDFICLSEVIEHVDNPKKLLSSIKPLLSNNGVVYLTTCSNCPSSDHVYLFNNIQEIKEMILDSSFQIIDELIISAEDITVEEALTLKLPLNYSAFLRKSV